MRTGKQELMAWMERSEKIRKARKKLKNEFSRLDKIHPINKGLITLGPHKA